MTWEESSNSTKYIVCGRGRCRYNCEGNKVFRRLVATNLASYIHFATRAKKSDLIQRVIDDLRNLGMIFVSATDDGITFEELAPEEARKKVAHRFRDAARRAKSCEYQATDTKKISLSIDVHFLQNQESKKVKKIMFISESFEKEEMQHSAQVFQTTAENLQSPTGHELQPIGKPEDISHTIKIKNIVSQKDLITSTYLERDVLDPVNICSMFYDGKAESLPSMYETLGQQEYMVRDLFDIVHTSPYADYAEDSDDWPT